MDKLNVLSLFDGMGCGRLAIDRVDLPIENYFASEIDDVAIKVTTSKYPNNIHLGDVTTVQSSNLPKIDLLIGGSPCQGFSFAGKQLNFEDPRSKLFFEFVRLLKETKPKYFLLENVNMKQEYQDIITEYLGVNPVRINSSLLSAQFRDRLYWTNIPITQIEDRQIVFNDIKDTYIDSSLYIPNKYLFTINDKISTNINKPIRLGGYMKQGQGQRIYSMEGKSVCLSALGGGWGAKTGLYLDGNNVRKPTVKELCRLQTIQDNYFDGLSLTYSQIAKMLGNGWTVDVIAHILKGIRKIKMPVDDYYDELGIYEEES